MSCRRIVFTSSRAVCSAGFLHRVYAAILHSSWKSLLSRLEYPHDPLTFIFFHARSQQIKNPQIELCFGKSLFRCFFGTKRPPAADLGPYPFLFRAKRPDCIELLNFLAELPYAAIPRLPFHLCGLPVLPDNIFPTCPARPEILVQPPSGTRWPPAAHFSLPLLLAHIKSPSCIGLLALLARRPWQAIPLPCRGFRSVPIPR